MLSARIERAVFPVHKNKMLYFSFPLISRLFQQQGLISASIGWQTSAFSPQQSLRRKMSVDEIVQD